MRKTVHLLITILCIGNLNAQTFTEHLVNRPITLPTNSQMADMDNDGDNDIVTVSRAGELVWYEQITAVPTFDVHYIEDHTSTMSENTSLCLSDIDQDGDMDIITISDYPTPELRWYMNDGNQNFSFVIIPSTVDQNDSQLLIVDMDNDSDLDIVVDKSNNILILENDGNQNFTENVAFSVSNNIYDFRINDFNGDNLMDITIAHDGGASVIIQTNLASFTENIASTTATLSIDVGDIDGDGDLDISIVEGSSIKFYYNQGNNSTFNQVDVHSGRKVNLKDIDNDNDLDLVYVPIGSINNIGIILNDGTLNFDNANPTEIPDPSFYEGAGVRHMLVADFDMDGINDIIETFSSIGRVNLYINDNGFVSTEVSQSAGYVKDISVADFNGDGFLDIVASSELDYRVEWYSNQGNNADFTTLAIDALKNPARNEEIDLDQDGDMDIVACQVSSGLNANFMWYENDGNGNFTYHFLMNIGNSGEVSEDVKVADMDNDGDLDIVAVAYPYTYVLYNDGSETFSSYTLPNLYQVTTTVAIHDIDNDGLKDIILWYDGEMSFCKNNNGSFNSPVAFTLNSTVGNYQAANSIEIADMDNDGDADIVFTAPSLGYMENIGNLTFNRFQLGQGAGGSDLKLADMDNDNDIDIVISGDGISLLENTPNGFVNTEILSSFNTFTYNNANSVQVVDMDGDNDLDIVYSGSQGARIAWLEQCNPTASAITETACVSYTSPSGNYTWTASDTYTDTIPNTAGCDSVVTINLTVIPPLVGTHNETVCDGGSIIVNGTTYDASNLSGTEVFANIGTYNCDSTVTVTLTIEPAIDVTVVNASPTLTANQTGATYQWIDCNNANSIISGETDPSFIAVSNGSYAVEITQNGCTDTSSCYIISIVGISGITNEAGFMLYPNPTNGQFTIEGGSANYTIEIYNAVGQPLFSQRAVQNRTQLNLQQQPSGIYHVSVIDSEEVSRFKVIKK